jgi:hypothetical protein
MTNTTELEKQIEQMVAAHVAALRKAAQGAVERAFAAATYRRCRRGRGLRGQWASVARDLS